MRMTRSGTFVAALLVAATAAAACSSSSKSGSSATTASGGGGATATTASGVSNVSVSFGAVNFTENEVLAYVYSDALKAAGFKSSVKPNLGSREVVQPALQSGAFDATVEYAGNYLAYLDPSAGNMSATATVAALQPLVAKKGLSLGNVSQAADSDAIAVTQANANKYHLVSIADLKPVAPQWTFGGPPECATRITCVPGLKQYYGVVFKSFKSLDEDGPITHTALANGNVQAARIFSSDAVIAQDHFVVLADPKNFQGAGNIIPVIRSGKATSQVMTVLNQVSGALTTADLIQFNLAVGVQHDDPSSVASQFVQSHHLG